MKQIVREITCTSQVFMETAQRPQPVVAPTDADLERAFNDLLASVTPAERVTITRDWRRYTTGKDRPRPALPTFVDTPEARAKARAEFEF